MTWKLSLNTPVTPSAVFITRTKQPLGHVLKIGTLVIFGDLLKNTCEEFNCSKDAACSSTTLMFILFSKNTYLEERL